MAAPSPTRCLADVPSSSSPGDAAQSASASPAVLIVDDAALDARIAELGEPVGVDTEFMRVRTFYPIPALYQLSGAGGVALVDPQGDATFASLQALLSDPARVKVMHSCSEDLEVFARHFDLRPAGLVDTQVAHAFLQPEHSASYAALAAHYLGVDLPKRETRSDWLRRPLSPQQLDYAREDAAYLCGIWERQRQALAERGRLAWFDEEMARRLAAPAPAPETWYRTFKHLSRLSERQLAVLRSLVAWREREARRRDLPRSWFMRDDALLALARRERLAAADLQAVLPKRAANRHAKALLAAHREGTLDPEPPERPLALQRADAERVRALRDVVQREAERLGMAPALLARRRDVEETVLHHRRHGELPTQLGGWRETVLGSAFRQTLAAA